MKKKDFVFIAIMFALFVACFAEGFGFGRHTAPVVIKTKVVPATHYLYLKGGHSQAVDCRIIADSTSSLGIAGTRGKKCVLTIPVGSSIMFGVTFATSTAQ